MKRITTLFLAITGLFLFILANAQYTGPGALPKSYSVKEIIDNASRIDKSDVDVKIKGHIYEQINESTYWFKDSTGKIRVDISKKNLPAKPFNEKTELILIGEVDYDLLEGVEIDVDHIEFISQE